LAFGRRIQDLLTARGERRPLASLLVALCFGLALSYVHFHHEVWRDEVHCWVLGKTSTGLADLVWGPRRYDGHPFLWYCLLHLASRIVPGVLGLHLVGIAIGVANTYLWFRYSGLPRLLRLLMLPTYLFFYEYGVVTRSYGLGMLLTFAFCALYRRERPRYLTLSVLLVLLALTSVYGAILTVALAIFLFTPRLKERTAGYAFGFVLRGDRRSLLLGVVILIAGAWLVVRTSFPPKDAYFGQSPEVELGIENLLAALRRYWLAMLASPEDWWTSKSPGSDSLAFAPWLPRAAALLFTLVLASFWRTPLLAVAYAVGVVCMGLFQELKYPGGMRHIGHAFVLFLACCWLGHRELSRWRPAFLQWALLFASFVVQIKGNYTSTRADLARPFSSAAEAADFLRPRLAPHTLLIASVDHSAFAAIGQLDRPFLSAETGEFMRSVVFHNRRVGVDGKRLFTLAKEAVASNNPVFFVLSYPLPATKDLDLGLRAVHRYTTAAAIVPDERYFIYELDRLPASSSTHPQPSTGSVTPTIGR
jgi:hypothetical protein